MFLSGLDQFRAFCLLVFMEIHTECKSEEHGFPQGYYSHFKYTVLAIIQKFSLNFNVLMMIVESPQSCTAPPADAA